MPGCQLCRFANHLVKRFWGQKLSAGLMLLTLMATHLSISSSQILSNIGTLRFRFLVGCITLQLVCCVRRTTPISVSCQNSSLWQWRVRTLVWTFVGCGVQLSVFCRSVPKNSSCDRCLEGHILVSRALLIRILKG